MNDYAYRDKTHFLRHKVKSLLENGGITTQQTEEMVKYGVNGGFDWIGVHDPALDSNPQELRNHTEVAEEAMKKADARPGMELMHILHIKSEAANLVSKLRELKEMGYNKAAVNTRALGNEDSLKALRRFSMEEDMFLYAANCERTRKPNNDITGKISIRQLMPVFGFDVVSYAWYQNIPEDADVTTYWLVGHSGVYLPAEKLISNEDFPVCNLRCCNGKHISEVFKNWEAHGKEVDKTFLHDVITLEAEFARMRELAKEDKLGRYFENRTALKNYAKTEWNVELTA